MSNTDDAISLLTALGFSVEAASEALRVCDGQVENAANYLLMNGIATNDAGTDDSSPSSNIQMIHSNTSQYSYEDGRSACTCMALSAARNFLRNTTINDDNVSHVNASFLEEVIQNGIAIYQQHFSKNATEHLSAEEIIEKGIFPQLQLLGGIRQGILSQDRNSPLGLPEMLRCIRESSSGWVACLITKTPETVLVCLSPGSKSVLIDTHPRPQQFAANGAYARIHSSENELWESLETIFPFTDLRSDVSELMAAMYNSFDVYALVPS
ncbi:hypothetical protein FisN_19Hu127 [Fistulifera solaris]|uniref:UBA domain-containing protein n=1 Tax=Fistulifera solaris TaxID=1519565 RepID=A0A1Z5K057_FISSO|nr:hypothetical protein FisN_19Hu127 [Fistulifera solaris]|eukprot:GAX19549.1 hypothetical protein FisN_19Hu127 [Fistulifera solaris]